MAASICPTIDAADSTEFRAQTESVASFATRLHIDVADGSMTPNQLVEVADIWWPGGIRADVHVMMLRPLEHLPALVALGPQLVIVHAEAEGDFFEFAAQLHHHGIEAGIALLPETPVEAIAPGLDVIDHVLIFSGNLGHFGGQADLTLLEKAAQLRQLKPQLELGWDGGVNDSNIKQLVDGGIDVLNVGSFIQKASNPHAAYATLKTELRVAGPAYQSRQLTAENSQATASVRSTRSIQSAQTAHRARGAYHNATNLFHRRPRTQS